MTDQERVSSGTAGISALGLAQLRKRILVVEDEAVIAMLIEDMLDDLGIVCVGPAGSIAEAQRLIATEVFDAALLDVHLHGTDSSPVAETLTRIGLPFAFATGHMLVEKADFPSVPVLHKPFDLATLAKVVDGLLTLPGAAVTTIDGVSA
ncbi:hypothetical protein GCM10011529_06550 [Polymorphobacter glacialis]|uniref:Response regulatory domain-containing protein n=1 Tax=Sandarakinorhabdus glacialis TaxID=1614636 RepID=A0A917E5J0_9SPHN|nr:hypothetical protein GCM10011529_06550 [Polymorphobacter glacialis]